MGEFEELLSQDELSTKDIENFFRQNERLDFPDQIMPDFEKTREQIETIVSGYDRLSVLKWLTSASLIQGNEEYFPRFLYSKYVVATLEDEIFGDEEFGRKELLQVLHKFGEDWEIVENYKSYPNDKQNRIGLDRREFHFIACENESPEAILEEIIRRYIEVDQRTDIFQFSVKEELIRLLEYQTKLVEFIEQREDYTENKDFLIPQKEFVDDFEEIWRDYPEFQSSLADSLNASNRKIDYNEIRQIAIEKANYSGIPIFFNTQIELFYIALNEKIVENHEKCEDILEQRLREDVIESLAEFIPRQGLNLDYRIEELDEEFDFAFIFDNRIAIGEIIPEEFDQDEHKREVQDTLDRFEKTRQYIKQGNLTKFGEEQIERSLEPVFFTISDDITKKVSFFEDRDLKYAHFSQKRVNYLAKRLRDAEKSALFLLKVVEEGQRTKKPQSGFMNIFEEALMFEVDEDTEISEYIDNPRKKASLWTDKEREMHRKRMPRIDKRTRSIGEPLAFKLIESQEEEGVFMGYSGKSEFSFYNYKDIFCSWEDSINPIEEKLASTIAKMCLLSLKQASEALDLDIGYKEIVISTERQAKKEGILPADQNPSGLRIANSKEDNLTHIIFDPQKLGIRLRDSHLSVFIQILNEVLLYHFDDYIPLELTFKMDFKPLMEFSIARVPYGAKEFNMNHETPTMFDLREVEESIIKEFGDEIETGTYTGRKAREILIEIHEYLQSELEDYLRQFTLDSVIETGFVEADASINSRKMQRVGLGGYKGTKHKERMVKEHVQKEREIGKYSAGTRFIIEKAVLHDIDGERDLGVIEWQKALAYASKIQELAASIANIRYLSEIVDIMEIDVDIEFQNGFAVVVHKENLADERHLQNQAKNLSELDSEEVFSVEPSEDLPEGMSEEPTLEDLLDFAEGTYIEEVNEAFYKDLGFYLTDYVYIIGQISHQRELIEESGLVKTKYSNLIDILTAETEIPMRRITSLLDFLTLELEGDIIQTWKVEGRERLFVKPFVKIDEFLVTGLETLFASQDRITDVLMEGRWILPDEGLRYIPDELEEIRDKRNDDFETQVFDQINSQSDYVFKGIAEPNEPDQVFSDNSDSKGEIDVLSIDLEEKQITLWEAKDIGGRIGPRELGNKVKSFVNTKESVKKLEEKEEYVLQNLEQIGDSQEIDIGDDWTVNSVFVFREQSYFKELIDELHDSISYGEIDDRI